MEKIKKFLKSDIVFAVSAILAFVSCFFVHPSKDYVRYIDFKTLSLLFCLMITVCGFRSINVFTALGNVLSKKADTNRKITFFNQNLINNFECKNILVLLYVCC